VLGAALDRLVTIVVHILEIPGGQRGTDDEGGIGVDHQLRQFGPDRDGGRFDRGSHAITFQNGSAVSSSSFSKSTCTGSPTSTLSGSMPRSSPSMRTPSSSSTSATTNGS